MHWTELCPYLQDAILVAAGPQAVGRFAAVSRSCAASSDRIVASPLLVALALASPKLDVSDMESPLVQRYAKAYANPNDAYYDLLDAQISKLGGSVTGHLFESLLESFEGHTLTAIVSLLYVTRDGFDKDITKALIEAIRYTAMNGPPARLDALLAALPNDIRGLMAGLALYHAADSRQRDVVRMLISMEVWNAERSAVLQSSFNEPDWDVRIFKIALEF